MASQLPIHGRGTSQNPPNRFEKSAFTPEPDDVLADEAVAPQTVFIKDASKSILTKNDSPDISFTYSINPYRGCEHGCSYCYARPYHEFLGLSAGLDFESKILVKEDAADLLREALFKPSYQPDMIAMSGVTDCYQPAERHYQLTRQCLQVLAEFHNPVGLITKNRLVERDIDILSEMAQWNGAMVLLSITTLNADLCGRLEPRASRPQARLQAITRLANAGIPVGVNAAPMIPGLTDSELPAIIRAAADAGATFAGYGIVRLPGAVQQVFKEWLQNNEPNASSKVLNHIRIMHGGTENDSRFGKRMKGDGLYADQIKALFNSACRKSGLGSYRITLNRDAFRRPARGQLDLFQ